MKKMLSITLAMLLAISLIGPVGAMADSSSDLSSPLSTVRIYASEFMTRFNSDGSYVPESYMDATVSGQTVTLNGVQTYGNVTTGIAELSGADNKCIEQDISTQNGRFSATLDLSQFTSEDYVDIYVTLDTTDADANYAFLTQKYHLYYTNGSWSFRYFAPYAKSYDFNMPRLQEPVKVNALDKSRFNAETIALSNSICSGITDNMLKIKAIYDWEKANLTYGVRQADVGGFPFDGVCDGFAAIMQEMCFVQDIPCIAVDGTNRINDYGYSHSWNEAYADDRWVIIDASASDYRFDMTYDNFISQYTIENRQTTLNDSLIKPNPQPSTSSRAIHNVVTIELNGVPTSIDAYNINGNNFVKLRDIAFLLKETEKKFSVGWDGATNAISLASGSDYSPVGGELNVDKKGGNQPAKRTTSAVYKDGNKIGLTAYNINNFNYFKLRDIGSSINFGVTYDSSTGTVGINTSTGYSN